jgi:HAMP domain-containing protein
MNRIARGIGIEGRLGGQILIKGMSGDWNDLIITINEMVARNASNWRAFADIIAAIAMGDFSIRIRIETLGEIRELWNTVNYMLGQLDQFSTEILRVTTETGTLGHLGAQIHFSGLPGVWKDIVDDINTLVANYTGYWRAVSEVVTKVSKGDLSLKISADSRGEYRELHTTINDMVDNFNIYIAEVTRVTMEMGTKGRLGLQTHITCAPGLWRQLEEGMDIMASEFTAQLRGISQVTTAIAKGDLSKKISVDAQGEILEMKNAVNTIVDHMNYVIAEVRRVVKEGKHDSRVEILSSLEGSWKNVLEDVNVMAAVK